MLASFCVCVCVSSLDEIPKTESAVDVTLARSHICCSQKISQRNFVQITNQFAQYSTVQAVKRIKFCYRFSVTPILPVP